MESSIHCNLPSWAGLCKAGLRSPWVSAKVKFRSESLKGKFNLVLFIDNLKTECSKKNWENFWWNAFEQKKKEPGLKFNLGLTLIGLRTTRPWPFISSYALDSTILEVPPHLETPLPISYYYTRRY